MVHLCLLVLLPLALFLCSFTLLPLREPPPIPLQLLDLRFLLAQFRLEIDARRLSGGELPLERGVCHVRGERLRALLTLRGGRLRVCVASS